MTPVEAASIVEIRGLTAGYGAYPDRRGPVVARHYKEGHRAALEMADRVMMEVYSKRLDSGLTSRDPYRSLQTIRDLAAVHRHGSVDAAVAAELR